ncbi:UDP-N-acetylmuramyl tripeptide synthase [Moorella thermoacetica Y72]|uniref:UDP-N-acetylmuramyl tripeptide synthase n=1 Tax=Moorella thermoacetica Y72 TaxID=1325331 RepID=A0A0S6U6L0_NEOTH|nr:UDP-N-acetylmuramyl tripeptide synthase [Moorella thermoacetica Y72]
MSMKVHVPGKVSYRHFPAGGVTAVDGIGLYMIDDGPAYGRGQFQMGIKEDLHLFDGLVRFQFPGTHLMLQFQGGVVAPGVKEMEDVKDVGRYGRHFPANQLLPEFPAAANLLAHMAGQKAGPSRSRHHLLQGSRILYPRAHQGQDQVKGFPPALFLQVHLLPGHLDRFHIIDSFGGRFFLQDGQHLRRRVQGHHPPRPAGQGQGVIAGTAADIQDLQILFQAAMVAQPVKDPGHPLFALLAAGLAGKVPGTPVPVGAAIPLRPAPTIKGVTVLLPPGLLPKIGPFKQG